jgi:hypothetical protein
MAILNDLPEALNFSSAGLSASAEIGCFGSPFSSVARPALHQPPDFVGDRDRVAIQIHAERRDDVGLRANTDGCTQRLAGEHVRTVELAGDHAIEHDLPVGLAARA